MNLKLARRRATVVQGDNIMNNYNAEKRRHVIRGLVMGKINSVAKKA
tara:strand:- start:64 stop:204 length:141 start_codon:yes stop_codon:yes gene_type:complete